MIELKLNIPDTLLMQKAMDNISYTYLDGRRCKYCITPFPDHTNKTREFCEKRVLSDGRIIDCKSLYWTPERRKESKQEKNKQQICSSFKQLLDYGKTELTWEEFCLIGFSLKLAKQKYISIENQIVALFNEGHLLIDPNTFNIKIVS